MEFIQTKTKRAFHEMKKEEYKELLEYFRERGDRMGIEQAAGMFHAHAYLEDTKAENAKFHFENGRSIYRLQANAAAVSYV